MATELDFSSLRPLFIAVAMFALIAGASFAWAAIEDKSTAGPDNETRVVSLPS